MKNNKINQEQIFYICLLGGCFLLYLMWAMIIPFDHGPDEHMRYQIPQFIYKYGYLPHGGDERIREATWGISYGFTPITSYIISALFMKITSFFTKSASALLLSARFVSVISSTGTVYFCIKISKKLLTGVFRYVFVISVALLPQFVFISSYVNNDAFGIFTIAWVIYAMLVAKEKNWDLKSCIFLGIGLGLCALSYYNCYGIILVALFYAIISVCFDKNIDNKLKFIFIRILWVAVPAFIIAGWWFIRNAIIYDGDFLGLNTSAKYSQMYAVEAYKPSNRLTPNNMSMSLKEMLIDRKWLESTISSFVGKFDAMSVPLEDWCYNIMYIVAVIGLLGSFIPRKISKMNIKNYDWIFELSMYIMCITTIGISVFYSYFSDFQPQGRYCLPMLVSLNIILFNGWSAIFNRCNWMVKCVVALSLVCI